MALENFMSQMGIDTKQMVERLVEKIKINIP